MLIFNDDYIFFQNNWTLCISCPCYWTIRENFLQWVVITHNVRRITKCGQGLYFNVQSVYSQVGRQGKTTLGLEIGFLWTSSGLQ